MSGISSPGKIVVEKSYYTNDIDESVADITYVGKQDETGKWFILKIDESGVTTECKYASQTNNATVEVYSVGWTNRVALTYGTYDEAF